MRFKKLAVPINENTKTKRFMKRKPIKNVLSEDERRCIAFMQEPKIKKINKFLKIYDARTNGGTCKGYKFYEK